MHKESERPMEDMLLKIEKRILKSQKAELKVCDTVYLIHVLLDE